MVEFSQLRKGQRYLFHKKIKKNEEKGIILFRANFIDIINDTLRVTNHEEELLSGHKKNIRTMPIDWIDKVETLEEIIESETILPSDVLLIIDDYA